MFRRLIFTAMMSTAALAASSHFAQAQYGGGYGFGGWGNGGAHTAEGDILRGMGVLAAGEGQYNINTAQARAINANTALNWNQYMYEAQQNTNHKYYAKMAARKAQDNKSAEALYLRLRDNPNKYDIYRGDALNVIFDDLCSPKIYVGGLKSASIKFPGELVRDLPFQYASSAITSTVHQVMTKGSAPAALKQDVFKPEFTQLQAVGQKIHEEDEADGKIDPETLDEAETLIKALMTKVAANLKAGTKDRNDADRWLKSALGLSRMLRTPAINVLLSDAAKHPEATVGDLLAFMKAYNLRFGVADSPRERLVYDQLYPIMYKMRDEAYPKGRPGLVPATDANHEHPAEFFSNLEEKSATPPPAPKPENK